MRKEKHRLTIDETASTEALVESLEPLLVEIHSSRKSRNDFEQNQANIIDSATEGGKISERQSFKIFATFRSMSSARLSIVDSCDFVSHLS